MAYTLKLSSETLLQALMICDSFSNVTASVVIKDPQRRKMFYDEMVQQSVDVLTNDSYESTLFFKNGSYIKVIDAPQIGSNYNLILLDEASQVEFDAESMSMFDMEYLSEFDKEYQYKPVLEWSDSHDYIGEFLNGFKTKP